MSDKELKASVQKRGAFAVGDLVTCKEGVDRYRITTPGVGLRVVWIDKENGRFRAKVEQLHHSNNGEPFHLHINSFELM